MGCHARTLFIALGNEYRSDDGIGVAIMNRAKAIDSQAFEYIHHNGDPADLIELWNNRVVILVDACQVTEKETGTIMVLDPLVDNSLQQCNSASSHALSLQEALGLGKILNKMPAKIRVYAVAGKNFSPGVQLSLAVEQAIAPCIEKIMADNLVAGAVHA